QHVVVGFRSREHRARRERHGAEYYTCHQILHVASSPGRILRWFHVQHRPAGGGGQKVNSAPMSGVTLSRTPWSSSANSRLPSSSKPLNRFTFMPTAPLCSE